MLLFALINYQTDLTGVFKVCNEKEILRTNFCIISFSIIFCNGRFGRRAKPSACKVDRLRYYLITAYDSLYISFSVNSLYSSQRLSLRLNSMQETETYVLWGCLGGGVWEP